MHLYLSGSGVNAGPNNLVATSLLVVMAVVLIFVILRGMQKRKPKPGQILYFEAEGKTSAECRALLGQRADDDLFRYKLEGANSGGWYIHFLAHNPTGQILDTLFLLQFEGDLPARFSLRFTREAFGQREPIIPESLLQDFFKQKLNAEPAKPFDEL